MVAEFRSPRLDRFLCPGLLVFSRPRVKTTIANAAQKSWHKERLDALAKQQRPPQPPQHITIMTALAASPHRRTANFSKRVKNLLRHNQKKKNKTVADAASTTNKNNKKKTPLVEEPDSSATGSFSSSSASALLDLPVTPALPTLRDGEHSNRRIYAVTEQDPDESVSLLTFETLHTQRIESFDWLTAMGRVVDQQCRVLERTLTCDFRTNTTSIRFRQANDHDELETVEEFSKDDCSRSEETIYLPLVTTPSSGTMVISNAGLARVPEESCVPDEELVPSITASDQGVMDILRELEEQHGSLADEESKSLHSQSVSRADQTYDDGDMPSPFHIFSCGSASFDIHHHKFCGVQDEPVVVDTDTAELSTGSLDENDDIQVQDTPLVVLNTLASVVDEVTNPTETVEVTESNPIPVDDDDDDDDDDDVESVKDNAVVDTTLTKQVNQTPEKRDSPAKTTPPSTPARTLKGLLGRISPSKKKNTCNKARKKMFGLGAKQTAKGEKEPSTPPPAEPPLLKRIQIELQDVLAEDFELEKSRSVPHVTPDDGSPVVAMTRVQSQDRPSQVTLQSSLKSPDRVRRKVAFSRTPLILQRLQSSASAPTSPCHREESDWNEGKEKEASLQTSSWHEDNFEQLYAYTSPRVVESSDVLITSHSIPRVVPPLVSPVNLYGASHKEFDEFGDA